MTVNCLPNRYDEAEGYFTPKDETEIVTLIQCARENNLKIRVVGSRHAPEHSIYGKNVSMRSNQSEMYISLKNLKNFNVDKSKYQVTVGAGYVLVDFCQKLDEVGFALPILGGILHQTVGGFVATCSGGGSWMHSFSDQIVGITLVDGTGMIHKLSKDNASHANLFSATGASFGLLGIIVEVTFQCEIHFGIEGQETVQSVKNGNIDLFNEDVDNSQAMSLVNYLAAAEYARLIWWPQPSVQKIVIWQAERVTITESFLQNLKPYQQVNLFIFRSARFAQGCLSMLFDFFSPLNISITKKSRSPRVIRWIHTLLFLIPAIAYPLLKGLFILVANAQFKGDMKIRKHFTDVWWTGIAMDSGIDLQKLPTRFSEIWIDVDDTYHVMRILRDFYHQKGFEAAGTFGCEIYATPKCGFWLSPAYDRDTVKINWYWFGRNPGEPDELFFPQFWQLLECSTGKDGKPLSHRYHWGKYLPNNPERLRSEYPRWDDFMAIRDQCDPDQLFLTDYWRERLGI